MTPAPTSSPPRTICAIPAQSIRKCSFARLAIAILALHAASMHAFPFHIHAGSVVSLERRNAPVNFTRLDNALLADDRKAPDSFAGFQKRQVAPDFGKVYVVIEISLKKGRSISLADYLLYADGSVNKCLGISVGEAEVYDRRRFMATGPGKAKLLFMCPADAELADLVPAEGFPLAPVRGLAIIPGASRAGRTDGTAL